MDKFILAICLLFLKFAFVSLLSLPGPVFDPLLALVVIYTFFHTLDIREFVLYALFCGFCRDIFSLDVFGIYMLSYLISAFGVALASRIIYRQNGLLVFPLVFIAAFLNSQIIFLLRFFVLHIGTLHLSGGFGLRCLVESIGTTLFAYPVYLFSKRCALGLTE